jgi:uncharacterized membrane protein
MAGDGFLRTRRPLIYGAFKLNYRAGRMYETVELRDDALTVTRVDPRGQAESWRFNPYWTRVSVAERNGRSSELSIASHGRRLVFGAMLTDAERLEVATALKDALRSGPVTA